MRRQLKSRRPTWRLLAHQSGTWRACDLSGPRAANKGLEFERWEALNERAAGSEQEDVERASAERARMTGGKNRLLSLGRRGAGKWDGERWELAKTIKRMRT